MRDFLPADVRKRNYVINIIREVYESYGFEPLETPAVENLDTLMGKYGEEGNQLIFKILKRGEKLRQETGEGRQEMGSSTPVSDLSSSVSGLADLALRYDLTVPLARVVANHRNGLPKFFKRYQIQPVWRADRPARGRYREFYQCDVDSIGSTSVAVEAELILAVSKILTKLGFEDFQIRVNHRDILFGILAHRFPENRLNEAIVILDKFDKIGINGVTSEFLENGFEEQAVKDFVNSYLVNLRDYFEKESTDYLSVIDRNKDWNDAILTLHDAKFVSNEIAKKANDDLRNLKNLLQLATTETNILIDATLARGLSYYTGAIFEIVLTDGDFKGSIGGGGRYDGLIGMFGKEQIPACGFSLGLERILVVMDERGMFPPEIAESAPADVMVTVWSEETLTESLRLANELRRSGLRVTLYPEPDKLGKQLKYADAIKVPYACILGESELAEGKVTMKNMQTGEQETIAREEVAGKVK